MNARCGSCTTFVRPTSRHILANKDAGLGVSSSFAVSTHCCTLKQTYSTSFQVTEIQTSSSLPHAHGLHWRDDLSEDDTRVLQVLQADEDCFKLSPQEVSSLLAYGTSAICVTLDPLRLRALHPKLTEQEALQVTLLAKHLQMHKYCQKCREATIRRGVWPVLPPTPFSVPSLCPSLPPTASRRRTPPRKLPVHKRTRRRALYSRFQRKWKRQRAKARTWFGIHNGAFSLHSASQRCWKP